MTIFSYQQTSDHLKDRLRAKDISDNTLLTTQVFHEEQILAQSPHEMVRYLSGIFPETLRESLFIRAVSQFEVFLIDSVWEISERTMDPFKRQDKHVEMSHAKLLSYNNIDTLHQDIIDGECRQLTSQGLDFTRKYYERRFEISFVDSSIPLSRINEIHERRHLFVHRGGKIDAKYQHRYANDLTIGTLLKIDDGYFRESLNDLFTLAEFISSRVDLKWPKTIAKPVTMSEPLTVDWKSYLATKEVPSPGINLAYWFKARFLDITVLDTHLDLTFSFNMKDEKHYLSEIFVCMRKISVDECEWIVYGDKMLVGHYVAYQKILHRRSYFAEFNSHRIGKLR